MAALQAALRHDVGNDGEITMMMMMLAWFGVSCPSPPSWHVWWGMTSWWRWCIGIIDDDDVCWWQVLAHNWGVRRPWAGRCMCMRWVQGRHIHCRYCMMNAGSRCRLPAQRRWIFSDWERRIISTTSTQRRRRKTRNERKYECERGRLEETMLDKIALFQNYMPYVEDYFWKYMSGTWIQ